MSSPVTTSHLTPEAVSAAVVHLVEALTYLGRVRALDDMSILSVRPRVSAAELRIAAVRERAAAERALTDLVGAVDHQACLALIRGLGEAERTGEARAEQAYKGLRVAGAQDLPAAGAEQGPGGDTAWG